MNSEISKRKTIAIRAGKQVGRILLASFGRSFRVKSKGDRNLVTEIDQKAERAILRLIKANFPRDGILSEESLQLRSQSGFKWIIDPIDGTHNFVHNIEVFGTSIAVEYGAQVVLGLIYMPYSDELYLAQKGKGAYRNGRKINVSRRKLRQATLIYDSSIRLDKGPMLKTLGRVADRVFNVRMFGSTVRSLSYIAEGKVEAEIEFNDKVWDFAAGLLLVEEAGGRATDFQGQRWNTTTRRYLASNGVVHRELLTLIGRA